MYYKVHMYHFVGLMEKDMLIYIVIDIGGGSYCRMCKLWLLFGRLGRLRCMGHRCLWLGFRCIGRLGTMLGMRCRLDIYLKYMRGTMMQMYK